VTKAADDAAAALEFARGMPETGSKAGVLGFCLGGRLAYMVGVGANPDVVVAYYGSGTADMLDDAPKLRCPVLFQFGGDDAYLPRDQIERIQSAFSGHSKAEIHTHPGAGHAFDNFRAPIFYHQGASEAAWPQTVAFLQRNYPADA
jgi:carboxymethylenebutenolidase